MGPHPHRPLRVSEFSRPLPSPGGDGLCGDEPAGAPGGRTRFYKGIELGQPNQDPDSAALALEGRDYDFVIGSIHNIRGYEDFFYLDYSQVEPGFIDALLTTYWEEEREVIAWGQFDALGPSHLPSALYRGGPRHPGGPLQASRGHRRHFSGALIDSGKALEVNTSGLRQKIGRALPDLPLVRRYRELGGRAGHPGFGRPLRGGPGQGH